MSVMKVKTYSIEFEVLCQKAVKGIKIFQKELWEIDIAPMVQTIMLTAGLTLYYLIHNFKP